MALGMAMLVGRRARHFGLELNISRTTEWIVMRFGTDIHALLRMNWNNFCDLPDLSFSTIIRSKYFITKYLQTNDIHISPYFVASAN